MRSPIPILAAILALWSAGIADAGSQCAGQASSASEGFSATAIVTSATDWKKKWLGTPSEMGVFFPVAPVLGPGDRARMLVFFSGAKVDGAGHARIECELRLTRPNGKATEVGPAKCFTSRLRGPASNVYMTGLAADIVVEPKDPRGPWRVWLKLTDEIGKRSTEMRFCFEVGKGGTNL